ncbi:alcohol dehydrogenase catalytic domain-containing protein, partial [Paracoccus sp. PXZ]
GLEPSDRGVVYIGPGKVEVQSIADPKLKMPDGRRIEHGEILKVFSTNICGSDQHMVRGRTTAEPGLILGHEITGEVIEKGVDVEMLEIGDIVSVLFNVACGRCRCCREGDTAVCLTVMRKRRASSSTTISWGPARPCYTTCRQARPRAEAAPTGILRKQEALGAIPVFAGLPKRPR